MRNQTQYYQKRAKEYEQIYQKPERQADLQQLKTILANSFHNKAILEIACGTGYWTQFLATKSNSILATDINKEVLELAQQKKYGPAQVEFMQMDFWQLTTPEIPFEACFGGFIWSHVLQQDLKVFTETILGQVEVGSQLIFIDNKFVEGNSTPIGRTDTAGNTYQNRTLQSGETFEVIKNFPNEVEVEKLLVGKVTAIKWVELAYYWVLTFEKAG